MIETKNNKVSSQNKILREKCLRRHDFKKPPIGVTFADNYLFNPFPDSAFLHFLD